VPAKVIKLTGLKNDGRVSPNNLITFAGTQNGTEFCRLRYEKNLKIITTILLS
jgi:hypothetical protein